MNHASPDVVAEPVRPIGMSETLWDEATLDQRVVLARITKQRNRIKAGAAAQEQAHALRIQQGADHVVADALLPERLMSFVRLHPYATAAAGAALLALGPRKLMRWGSVAMPWIIKLQQRRAR